MDLNHNIPRVSSARVARPGYQRVAEDLRRDIIDGSFPPGTRLKMHALAERYGVSPQPVREALQVLSGEGLVQLEPNRGAHVRGINLERLRHIYELREAIEAALTRRFAEEASLSHIRSLQEIQKAHDRGVLGKDYMEADKANFAFHRLIMDHSGNTEAIELRDRYLALSLNLRGRFGYSEARWEAARRDHHDLLDAFVARDSMSAYVVASRHVRRTLDELLTQIDTTVNGSGAAAIPCR